MGYEALRRLLFFLHSRQPICNCGIMIDDVLAGLMALVCVALLHAAGLV